MLSSSGYGQQLKKSIPAVKYGNNPKAGKYNEKNEGVLSINNNSVFKCQ
jgi:hypothetical protein